VDAAILGLISAATAVAGGAITKTVDSWLGSRSKVGEELREERLRTYLPVWNRTRIVSRWPRTEATYGDLDALHRDLREWYFGVGGIYLSENARDRYGKMQELIDAHLAGVQNLSAELPDSAYTGLMDECSAFRSALTEDLESRRQRSLIWTLDRRHVHKRQARESKARAAEVARSDERRGPRVALDHAYTQQPETPPQVTGPVPGAGPAAPSSEPRAE
jgi:hypothetical protein